MQTYTDRINVYLFEGGSVDVIDVVTETSTPYGVLTWRREGQDVPKGMRQIYDFPASDAQTLEMEALGAFVDRIMYVNRGTMRSSQAIAAVDKVYKTIRNAIPSGDGWGYRHSQRYYDLVESNKHLLEAQEAGELAPWEEELLSQSSRS